MQPRNARRFDIACNAWEKGATVPEQCEFLEKCGFFVNYQWNAEVVKQGWVALYCADKAESDHCARKKVRRETGQPPVDNMCPAGTLLPMI